MSLETCTITTADGMLLEAERSTPETPIRMTAVLCHPHPLHGGTMRSIVISALFEALPAAGVECLRFNFRGVEGSTGTHDEGRAEQLDVRAAIDAAAGADAPLLLAGWSFGADMTLATADPRLAGWLAIAPPLRFRSDYDAVAHDARPKRLVLGEHDEIRAPAAVVDETATWNATHVDVIKGASHYFLGRTDRVVAVARAFVEELVG
jgi:alpha/beta superfamily hydrolase